MAGTYEGGAGRGARVPLVGRAAELDRLDAVLERLGAGGPAAVDVCGEAGIGGSRLLAECASQAATCCSPSVRLPVRPPNRGRRQRPLG